MLECKINDARELFSFDDTENKILKSIYFLSLFIIINYRFGFHHYTRFS